MSVKQIAGSIVSTLPVASVALLVVTAAISGCATDTSGVEFGIEKIGDNDDLAYEHYKRLRSDGSLDADDRLAAYWERRGDRDRALVTVAAGLVTHETLDGRQRLAALIGLDYSRLIVTLRHPRAITAVALSNGGQVIATARADGAVELWDVDSGDSVAAPFIHSREVVELRFSPDDKTLVTADLDRTVRAWHISRAAVVAEASFTRPVPRWCITIAVVRASRREGPPSVEVAVDQSVRIEAGLRRKLEATDAGRVPRMRIANSMNGQFVVSGPWKDGLHVWNVENGGTTYAVKGVPKDIDRLAVTSNGHSIVAITPAGELIVYSVGRASPTFRAVLPERVTSVAFSADERHVFVGTVRGVLRAWELESGRAWALALGNSFEVRTIAVSYGRQIVATGATTLTRIWDSSGVKMTDLSPSEERHGADGPVATSVLRLWSIRSVTDPLVSWQPRTRRWGAIGSTGVRFLAVSGTATTKEARSETEASLELRHFDPIVRAAFSKNANFVSAMSDKGSVRIWRTSDGQQVGRDVLSTGQVSSIAVSDDGNLVAVGHEDGDVAIMNSETGKEVIRILQYRSAATALAFDPHGRLLATGSDDGAARIWNLRTGERAAPTLFGQGRVSMIRLGRDGNDLTTVSAGWLNTWRLGGRVSSESHQFIPLLSTAHDIERADDGRLAVLAETQPTSHAILSLILDLTPAPVSGDPTEMLARWQKQLGLRRTRDGRIQSRLEAR